ncbi:MAG: polymer-forming cytoskeletal protein [Terracidiphilus sp.]
MQVPTEKQNQHSMIGKTIVIKGEIAASDPLYISGSVEGSISAPANRVTVGKEGRVKASVSAREVVVMGEVSGSLEGSYRVEIRSDGSVTGDLAAHRVCVEEGAVLKGKIDIRKAPEPVKADLPEELATDAEAAEEATSAA